MDIIELGDALSKAMHYAKLGCLGVVVLIIGLLIFFARKKVH